ncbi:polyhydroxyalkanoate depolymerase [Variovorax sp. J22G21]|uniref:polyhydroxyalkanoate depolymerase n=1 Tax=Variovorax fucosicus TaxID=3053517 RepID=UPI00257899E2|nr:MULTISPECIES: polyhydroxyalkanoate depolymerase [unclassified Variovorax]MDM0040490.1 polyhydroxyalkanoate depolymerase [Variovorax sp. J22R193]MDM0058608.1 polyhydroxyalkanoate depolymerase [Variovorax sp. J22G47]MDM0061863.1 polyhydroxyalkanoate depolymerase [Variovorax sp. J22G21]
MLYRAYQTQADMLSPLRLTAQFMGAALWSAGSERSAVRRMAAQLEVFSRMRITHSRPAWDIKTVVVEGQEVAVHEEPVLVAPFGTLLHFRKETGTMHPPVLLAAPLSGHFATLLRETVRTLLRDHDVYVTDWHNARDVPVWQGGFGLDEYTLQLISFMEAIGPGVHLVAVCQPCVAALAATALMAEDDNPAAPRSLTLMAGPVDCRINPTGVNTLATSKPIEWFKRNLISRVPWPHAGATRRVYPGFLQLSAFMSMNPARHKEQFKKLFEHLVEGEIDKADTIRNFYDEYLAVNDLPAEFYLETVERVFQTYDLPRGELTVGTRRVNPAAIRRTALLTVEGERDDICAVGQTVAAQDLCTNIRPYLKVHHLQAGVGHYGVFSGSKWNAQIYPRVRETIHAAAELH